MAQSLSGAVHPRDIDVSKDEESSSDERRVRPRPDTLSAAQAQAAHSPAKHLTARRRALAIDDLLQSFFKFLGLGELATVMRVCKYWRNFVTDKMPCTEQKLRLLPTLLLGPSRSLLVRHVSELSFDPTDEEISGEALFVLATTNWHNLRELTCRLDASEVEPFVFPATLRHLVLHLADESEEGVANVIEIISHLPELQSLSLHTRFVVCSLAALQRTKTLRNLEVSCEKRNIHQRKRDALMDSCRLLTQLNELHVYPASAARLLRAPHQLNLRKLGWVSRLDDAGAELLQSLPSLGALFLMAATCSSFAFVARMQRLREMYLSMDEWDATAHQALLESATAGHLARLRTVTLARGELTIDEVTRLLQGMPHLAQLTLKHLPWLSSLRFLTVPALRASLTELSLVQCQTLPLVELEHVHGLQKLQVLEINQSTDAPLSAYEQRLFTPGRSPLLPKLTCFHYTPPPEPRPPAPPFDFEDPFEDEEAEFVF